MEWGQDMLLKSLGTSYLKQHKFEQTGEKIMLKAKTAVLSALVGLALLSSSSYAALSDYSTETDALVAGITADVGTALGIGFAVMVVGLGARVGFNLVKSFASSGAN